MTPANARTAQPFTDDTPAPFAELIVHPCVRTFLEERVRGAGYEGPTAEGLVGQVMLVLAERCVAGATSTLRRVLGLARQILDGKAVDHLRHETMARRVRVDLARLGSRGEDVPLEQQPPLHGWFGPQAVVQVNVLPSQA